MITQSEMQFDALGTQNGIMAYGAKAQRAIEQAISRVWEIHQRMSAYDEDSQVSMLFRNAGIAPQRVSFDVLELLQRASAMSALSGGAFDVTVRPLTALWNFSGGGDIPSESDIQKAKALVNYKALILDALNRTAYLSQPGMAVDLGGIAKGYAADEVRHILKSNGVQNALINLGGNIVAMGEDEQTDGTWRIGVQNPLSIRGDIAASVCVCDKAVVTSGVNERFFLRGGRRYHHILDPKTGYPAESNLLSVTVIADSSELADALSTSVFVLGIEDGMPLLQKQKAEAVFILKSGDIFSTFPMQAF